MSLSSFLSVLRTTADRATRPLVIHPCAILSQSRDSNVCSGFVSPVHLDSVPRSAIDRAILSTCRELSGRVVTSGKNVRLEQGWMEHFLEDKAMSVTVLTKNPGSISRLLEDMPQGRRVQYVSSKSDGSRHRALGEALDLHFKSSNTPVCLEVGPTSFISFYQDSYYIAKYQSVLLLSTFTVTTAEDFLDEWRTVGAEIEFRELVNSRRMKPVQTFVADAEGGVPGHWTFRLITTS